MKKRQLPLLIILLGMISGLTSGCQSKITQISKLIPTITLKPTLTYTPRPTHTPTKTSTATPTFTPIYTLTPVPVSFKILPTTLQQSGKWHFIFPVSNPNSPELITTNLEGYHLDPVFQVDSLDLSYEWGGLGDPVMDYQRIERRGTRFWRGDTAIAAESVKDLIRSIDHLYPQPLMVNSITHTDDYPIWSIELTSIDGNHVLLYSNSNGPNNVPWNVIYNGQIYSQFNGDIAKALSKLFEVSLGQPMAWTSQGDAEEGYLIVDTTGWPGQMSNGFSGLLAVQSSFNYWPDNQKGELHGYFQGRSSVGGMGNMIIGSITDLQKIELELDKGQTVDCVLNVLQSDDPAAFVWEFVCPVGNSMTQNEYRYPVKITFSTDQNKEYTVTGELFGNWEQGTELPVIRYPEEIGKILEGAPAVQDLLTDHQMVVIKFNAAVDPATGLMDHRWSADIVLLGQATIANRILQYSVTVEAEIKDKELVHWDLNRIKLKTLLNDVLNQAITRHFLEGDPNLVLNLYYGEGTGNPIVSEMDTPPCVDLPVAFGLPNEQQPLRGFAFNQSWNFLGIQILFINNKLRIIYLDINPSSQKDAIWTSLLPHELQPINTPPFDEISVYPWSPSVYVLWGQNASTQDIKAYEALVQTWPGEGQIYSWGALIKPDTLGITPDGHLSLIVCKHQ